MTRARTDWCSVYLEQSGGNYGYRFSALLDYVEVHKPQAKTKRLFDTLVSTQARVFSFYFQRSSSTLPNHITDTPPI